MSTFEAPVKRYKVVTKRKKAVEAGEAENNDAEETEAVEVAEEPFKVGLGEKKLRKVAKKYGLPTKELIGDSLMDRHIATLYAIVQRSLFMRDFARASRAFGLLLRSQGKRADAQIEIKALWEIGLAILEGRENNSKTAVDYLNILAVRHPYRHGMYIPQGTELWSGDVDVVQQKRIAKKFSLKANSLEFRYSAIEHECLDPNENMERVVERIKEVMLMPPWNDDVRFWMLRGMAGLCVADRKREGLGKISPDQRKEWEAGLHEVSSQGAFSQGEGRLWHEWRKILEDVRVCFKACELKKETVCSMAWDGLEELERWGRGDLGDKATDDADTTNADTTISADTTMGDQTFSTIFSRDED